MTRYFSFAGSRFAKSLAVVLAVVLFPLLLLADQLEVRRAANVYAEPNRSADVLVKLDPAQNKKPLLIRILDNEKINGYYHVRTPGANKKGWIYKTYVRRLDRPHPDYVPYDRTLYRHWIDEDGNCRNTRDEILIRDATGKVTFTKNNDCQVKTGAWKDPYTGQIFNDPKKLDIDHMVPLKNAHESGAWAWSAERRREYANFMGFKHHLLAVSASENRRKGDKGPDRYLPPSSSYKCTYVKDWIKIKEDWQLETTEDEGATIENILKQCN